MPAAAPIESPGGRKARGAFFTPAALCRHVVEWAIRRPDDRVLEPSCGEAAFLLAAARRLSEIGANGAARLRGVELHGPSARAAGRLLREAGLHAEIEVADFLARDPEPAFTAVVGNPPYIRYQAFSGESRERARAAAARAGVRLTALASSWAAFTVHASLFVAPGGRLGLVLPAELLSVNYAREIRAYLLRRFGRVRLLLFSERVFPGALEEVVLLMAEGEGPAGRLEIQQVRDAAALGRRPEGGLSAWVPPHREAKWTPALLRPRSLSAYRRLADGGGFTALRTWGETTLGAVTGRNRFFALAPREVARIGLSESDRLAISPPGSRHLRALTFTASDWSALGASGARTWLFRPDGDPSAAARRHIADGEAQGVHRAYKCRVRDPWWRTPVVAPPDLFVTYMNADTPRLATNEAGVRHLNSVHGLYLDPPLRDLGRRLLPLASLSTMTLLGAEVVGRAYGGGLLKLEPGEADRLPVPAPALVERAADELEALRPRLVELLRAGELLAAVRLVDRVLLVEGAGAGARQVAALEEARAALAARRAARGRAAPPLTG